MTVYVNVELYGFSTELPVQKQIGPVLVKLLSIHKKRILYLELRRAFSKASQPLGHCGATVLKIPSCRQGRTTYWVPSINGKVLPF